MKLTEVNSEFADLPEINILDYLLKYMLEVYMDDYTVLYITNIRAQLHHVTNAVMTGIHDMLPLDKYDDRDSISFNKILKK